MERIGFIGLGIMGKPMAANLLAAGYPVVAHNRSRRPVDELVERGAEPASSPREVAERSDVVITMLPDSPEVEAVVLGDDGVAGGVREGMAYVDMSTIAPAMARHVYDQLQHRGVEAVDAPVSGGQVGAEAGELSIMVGGTDAAVERIRPIFDVLGKVVTHIGGPGTGQVAKAANQVALGVTLQGVAEALVMARKAGADPAKVRQALLGGFAQSKALEVHGQRMLDATFTPGFRLSLHRKDLAIALQTGRDHGVPLLATGQLAAVMDALVETGHGEEDDSAVVAFYTGLTGLDPDGLAAS